MIDRARVLISSLKTELIDDGTERAQELADELSEAIETLIEERDNLKEDVEGLTSDLEAADIDLEDKREVMQVASSLKEAYERLNMGVNTEIDTIIELTDKLISHYY